MTNEDKDIEFLLIRSMEAGICSFRDTRTTGTSSNSIVAIAYGIEALRDQYPPSDPSDLAACFRMFFALPEHRRTVEAKKAMVAAIEYMEHDYPDWRKGIPESQTEMFISIERIVRD